MLNSVLEVVVVAGIAFGLGWSHREMQEKVRFLRNGLTDLLIKRNDEQPQPRSSIVEPKQETPAQRAKREQDELLERLNP